VLFRPYIGLLSFQIFFAVMGAIRFHDTSFNYEIICKEIRGFKMKVMNERIRD
jgi:hypothetical protein